MLRSSRFDLDELSIQSVCEPGDDLVLHVEEVGDGLVEALGPEVCASLSVDELHVDAHSAAAALNAAFEDVANVQFASNLLKIDVLALVGKRRVAPDDKGARNAREVGGQALGDAVDEIVLLRIVADIGER